MSVLIHQSESPKIKCPICQKENTIYLEETENGWDFDKYDEFVSSGKVCAHLIFMADSYNLYFISEFLPDAIYEDFFAPEPINEIVLSLEYEGLIKYAWFNQEIRRWHYIGFTNNIDHLT